MPNGQLGAGCKHSSCAGRGWKHFKGKIGPPDPDHYDPPLQQNGRQHEQAAQAKSEQVQLPAIQDAYDFCAAELPLPEELIQGVLHRASKLSLGGASKSYKTWTLMNLAMCVAYEVPWLGCSTRQAKVLVVNLEIQSAFARKRLGVLADAMGIVQEPGRLDIWNLRGCAPATKKSSPKSSTA